MPLAAYAAQCWPIAAEFEQYLLDAERGEIEKLIGSLSRLEWWEWRRKHEDLLDTLVALAPSARAKQMQKLDRRTYLMASLAARQRCLEAAHLLRAVANARLEGNSYRRAAAEAGGVFQEIFLLDVPLCPEGWPLKLRFRDG